MTIELAGHPERSLCVNLDDVPEDMWVRIALEHVLGLRYHAQQATFGHAHRCEGWSTEFDIDSTLRDKIDPLIKEARRIPAGTGESWITVVVRKVDRSLIAPVVRELRQFAAEIATTWFACFHLGDEHAVVDHRGAVMHLQERSGRMTLVDLEKWGHPQHPDEQNRDRSAKAVKSLLQAFSAGSAHKKDLCCPDPAGRSVLSDEWPAHFPVGCAPESLPAASGTVYRLCTSAPDFVSTLESEPKKKSWSCQCEKAALSCWRTLEAIRSLRANRIAVSPKFRLRRIMRARLEPAHGRLGRTGPMRDHVSLWLKAAHLANASTLFEILHDEDLEPSDTGT